ncbi:hypothetical protein BC827DRAFT_1189232 [Russula dissimulans]|nr:hypothetical protein BC827DRAFT_1189232 [Russula dissimulans]
MFASPVRWIETLDLFLEQYKFKRFVEIGPSLTLTAWLSAPLNQNKPEMTRLILFAVQNPRQPQNQMYLLRPQDPHPLQSQLCRP